MGFRFSLEHANWLAHILQPSGARPHAGALSKHGKRFANCWKLPDTISTESATTSRSCMPFEEAQYTLADSAE